VKTVSGDRPNNTKGEKPNHQTLFTINRKERGRRGAEEEEGVSMLHELSEKTRGKTPVKEGHSQKGSVNPLSKN